MRILVAMKRLAEVCPNSIEQGTCETIQGEMLTLETDTVGGIGGCGVKPIQTNESEGEGMKTAEKTLAVNS